MWHHPRGWDSRLNQRLKLRVEDKDQPALSLFFLVYGTREHPAITAGTSPASRAFQTTVDALPALWATTILFLLMLLCVMWWIPVTRKVTATVAFLIRAATREPSKLSVPLMPIGL